ncbi:MAG: hypothetical protein WBC91_00530 [Phototrophicaceae bacterium]
MTMKNYLLWTIGLCCSLACLLLIASPAYACSPSEDALNYTLEDRVNNADMILVGTVVGGEIGNPNNNYEVIRQAEVDVERYLKGEGESQVQIHGFGDGADCLSVISMEQRAIFFVDRDDNGVLQASYLGVNDATMRADIDTIEEIIAITGESNAPYPASLVSQITRLFNMPMTWLVLSSVVLLFLCGGLFIQNRLSKDTRKVKSKRS